MGLSQRAIFLAHRQITGKILYMYRIPIVIIFAFFVLGAGPCGEIFDSEDEETNGDASVDCTVMGCANMLSIEVIRPDDMVFLSGAYRFEFHLPDESEYMLECYLNSVEVGFNCSLGDTELIGVQVAQTGTTIYLTLLGAPEQVDVIVKYSDAIIGQRSFQPIYEEILPNGPECQPTCFQAEEALAVQSW